MTATNAMPQTEEPLEIPESGAPPVDELVSGDAPPAAEGARAQIPEPELPPPPAPPEPAPAEEMPGPVGIPDASEWREVAQGRPRARRRKAGGAPGPAPAPEAETEIPPPTAKPAMDPKVAEQIRQKKAEGYVMLAQTGLLILARRFDVAEKEIAFTEDEQQLLTVAVAPLVKVEDDDPWTNLLGVGLVVVGPRLQALNSARLEKKKQQHAEREAA